MTNLTNWLKKNGYEYEGKNLHNGGRCIFVKIFEVERKKVSKLYPYLKRSHLNFSYAGSYSWIRIDFKEVA